MGRQALGVSYLYNRFLARPVVWLSPLVLFSLCTQAKPIRLVLNEGLTSAFRLHYYSAQVEPKMLKWY